jgi:hypothetical protein
MPGVDHPADNQQLKQVPDVQAVGRGVEADNKM